jgi:hypothetical protein
LIETWGPCHLREPWSQRSLRQRATAITVGPATDEMRFRLTRYFLRGYGAALGMLGLVADSVIENMASDAQIGKLGR